MQIPRVSSGFWGVKNLDERPWGWERRRQVLAMGDRELREQGDRDQVSPATGNTVDHPPAVGRTDDPAGVVFGCLRD